MIKLFNNAAWRRLKKNKGAMAGLVVIILSVVVSVGCYFIAPDSSPFANRIILE
ncbi:MAG TPA: ABC transporter permease, partial [Niabella sp.]|nr:ABC transporter permease [Niabella sp.]